MPVFLKIIEIGVIKENLILGTNCYIIGSDLTRECYIIDPGADPKRIIHEIDESLITPVAIILTHGHPDHYGVFRKLKRRYNVPLWYNMKDHKKPLSTIANRGLEEGDELMINSLTFKVLETPGHSPGSITIYLKKVIEHEGKAYPGVIFSGDIISENNIGRTDHEHGNRKELLESIREKIIEYPKFTGEFLILPGNGPSFSLKHLKSSHSMRYLFTQNKKKKGKMIKIIQSDLKVHESRKELSPCVSEVVVIHRSIEGSRKE